MLSPPPSPEAIREADRLFWLQVIAEMNLKPGITGSATCGQESPYRHGGR
jgi:hypothetical protein